MLSRLATRRICGTVLRVKQKARGVRNTLKCGPGKKGVQTPDDVLLSESRRNRKLRMVQTILEICLSETLASENREYVHKIFHTKQC